MRKKIGMGLVCMSLLLGGCGNAAEEAVVLGENMQESETVGESEASVDEPVFEQDSEEPETEEFETEEVATEEPETEDSATESEPEKTTYIAQEFLDLLEQYLNGNVGMEVLEEILCDHELSKEELESYAADPVVAEFIRKAEEVTSRGGYFLKVDGDNDGIEDILAWVFNGGSLGNNSRYFLKGQADGSFQYTCGTEGLTQELGFVRYGGMVYLLETDFDYSTKVVNGFIVSLYQDGEVVETLSLNKVTESYEPRIVRQSAGYEEAAAIYGEEGRNNWEDGFDELGTGERKVGYGNSPVYSSDLDNNGEEERYYKHIWIPTNISTRKSLQEYLYKGKDEIGDSILDAYGLEYEGVPEYFWVDNIGGKQILLLFCYKDLQNSMLYGYLIEEEKTTTVLEIDYIGVSAIEYKIYTKGINYGKDPWDPW